MFRILYCFFKYFMSTPIPLPKYHEVCIVIDLFDDDNGEDVILEYDHYDISEKNKISHLNFSSGLV